MDSVSQFCAIEALAMQIADPTQGREKVVTVPPPCLLLGPAIAAKAD